MSEVNLSTDETRVSYGIGRQLGDQLRDNPPPGVSLDMRRWRHVIPLQLRAAGMPTMCISVPTFVVCWIF